MVEFLLFYSGMREARFFSALFASKAGQEARGGVLYPEFPHFLIPGLPTQDYLNTLCTDAQRPQLIAELKNTRDAAKAANARALILGVNTFRPCLPYLRTLGEACRILFPKATQHFFMDLTGSDDLLLEEAVVPRSVRRTEMSPDDLLDFWISVWPTGLDAILRDLFALFGRENVHCGDGNSALNLLRPWEDFGAGPPAELARLPFIPHEVLAFAQATLPERYANLPRGAASPWEGELRRFSPESGYAAPSHSLLGPARRAALLAACAPGHVNTAKILGLERLYADPAPEPDWEPFPGLTREAAVRAAKRLDLDFAAARMAELDALPYYCLTHDQRLAHEALHEVCDTGPAAPFPFVRTRPEPKLSVLTLTYNHAAFIAKNIDSVLAQQTDFPIQHIIADDGSDDGTRDIILDYAARHPHIVPVFRKDRKVPASWNNVRALFDMARTEYAALCDGDDYFTDPRKLQLQVDFLDAHKDCALCFHVVRVTYEDPSMPERLYPPVENLPRGVRDFYYLSDLIKCNFIQTNSAVYRWRFKNGVPGWFCSYLMPGDWYWHLLHAELGKIGFINKIMSVYHRHEKGVYYLSEVDILKHRATVGLQEVAAYDVINKHFEGKYKTILFSLANSVFADCALYDSQREEGDEPGPALPALCDAHPEFARHFLKALKISSDA